MCANLRDLPFVSKSCDDDSAMFEKSGAQEIELTAHIEVKQALHRAVWRDNASLHTSISNRLFHFGPFFIVTELRTSQGNRYPSDGHVLCAWIGDQIGGLSRG